MRGHNKPEPTCRYHEGQPCAKPKDCPVHGPILDRPKKKQHLLRAGLESFSWNKNSTWHRTLCGIWLHKRLEFGIGPMYDFEQRQKIEFSGFRIRLSPSTDPNYEVFLEVGYSHKEVLCTTGPLTDCMKCGRQLTIPFKYPEPVWDKTLFEEFMKNIDSIPDPGERL